MKIFEILSESQRSTGIQTGLDRLATLITKRMVDKAMRKIKQRPLKPRDFGVSSIRSSITIEDYNQFIEPIKQFIIARLGMKTWFQGRAYGGAAYQTANSFGLQNQKITYYDRDLISALDTWAKTRGDKERESAQHEIYRFKSITRTNARL